VCKSPLLLKDVMSKSRRVLHTKLVMPTINYVLIK
jgi:hypothetical protein